MEINEGTGKQAVPAGPPNRQMLKMDELSHHEDDTVWMRGVKG
jgi:hypothetical protein